MGRGGIIIASSKEDKKEGWVDHSEDEERDSRDESESAADSKVMGKNQTKVKKPRIKKTKEDDLDSTPKKDVTK